MVLKRIHKPFSYSIRQPCEIMLCTIQERQFPLEGLAWLWNINNTGIPSIEEKDFQKLVKYF